MGLFSKIEDAESSKGGNWVLPGTYPLLFINAVKTIKSQEDNSDLFVAELDIIDSKVEGRDKGSSMSWIVNFAHQPALGNIKAFIAAAMGRDESEISEKIADAVVTTDNPLHGQLVRCEATEITTKKKKQPFTKCNWSGVAEDKQAEAGELHKAAGFEATPF